MPVPVLTEIHVIGHRIGMKHTLLAMTALTVGCGSRTTLDATSPADAAAAAPTSETCGFEVGGILHASVVGTPSACACGTEIPFILLKCTGKVADETYSLSVDYIP
jgi:hypothetical protein